MGRHKENVGYKPFVVELGPAQWKQLEWLAKEHKKSKAWVVRSLIARTFSVGLGVLLSDEVFCLAGQNEPPAAMAMPGSIFPVDEKTG